MGGTPAVEHRPHAAGEGSELGVSEDGAPYLRGRDARVAVPRTATVGEEGTPQGREDFPVVCQRVDVALGDAAVQVGAQVVQVLRLA